MTLPIRCDEMTPVLFLLLVVPLAVLGDNCAGKPDGAYEAGCKSYLQCTNGVGTLQYCTNPEVFDRITSKCEDPEKVGAPCGLKRDCSSLANGKYVDIIHVPDCTAYYTCQGGEFFGYNICPTGLIFDEQGQFCNWKYNVAPPCGTAVSTVGR